MKKSVKNSPIIEFQCGDTKGPFNVIRIEKNDRISSESFKMTMADFTGELFHFEAENDPILKRLQPVSNPLFANCVLIQTGRNMHILITKDIPVNSILRCVLIAEKGNPTIVSPQSIQSKNDQINQLLNHHQSIDSISKKFDCSKCHVASFNNIQNLKIHEELYCIRSPKIEVSSNQNTIFLPLAVHELKQKNAIQVIGPIHSLIPIAVDKRGANEIKTNSLIINNSSFVTKLATNLNINLPPLNIDIPIVDIDKKIKSNSKNDSQCFSLKKTEENDLTSSTTSSPNSKCSDPDKPFICSCGVSFSNERTFDAHRNFYCKNSSAVMNGKNEIGRKIPDKCAHCEFKPSSFSQLSMHIRSVHQATTTFTCQVCGYRAFSMRGIRTHMRSHSSQDFMKFSANPAIDSK